MIGHSAGRDRWRCAAPHDSAHRYGFDLDAIESPRRRFARFGWVYGTTQGLLLARLCRRTFATPGPLGASRLVIGTAALDADDNLIYNPANGALLYDVDGSGAGAAIQFATMAANLALTTSNFLIV